MSVMSSPASWKRNQLRAQRVPVALAAKVVTLNTYHFPEVADISQTGAKVIGSAFPPVGATALLRVKSFEVLCRVVRIAGEECGLRFEEPVSPRVLKELQLAGAAELAAVA
jgi:hypothetical protein